jgi:hypothetical protein
MLRQLERHIAVRPPATPKIKRAKGTRKASP